MLQLFICSAYDRQDGSYCFSGPLALLDGERGELWSKGERVDLLLLGEKRGDMKSESIVNINEEDGWLGPS